MWFFSASREFAIGILDQIETDPFHQLELAAQCQVQKWVLPAYDAVCRRQASLRAQEGRKLGWDRFAAICDLRERIARGDLAPTPGNYDYLLEVTELGGTSDTREDSDSVDPTCVANERDSEPDAPSPKVSNENVAGFKKADEPRIEVVTESQEPEPIATKFDKGSIPPDDDFVGRLSVKADEAISQTPDRIRSPAPSHGLPTKTQTQQLTSASPQLLPTSQAPSPPVARPTIKVSSVSNHVRWTYQVSLLYYPR